MFKKESFDRKSKLGNKKKNVEKSPKIEIKKVHIIRFTFHSYRTYYCCKI